MDNIEYESLYTGEVKLSAKEFIDYLPVIKQKIWSTPVRELPKEPKETPVITSCTYDIDTPEPVLQDTKVTLRILNTNDVGVYPIILAPSPATRVKTEEVYKTSILQLLITLEDNTPQYRLITPSILVNGTIIGNVLGTATPNSHASVEDIFGLGTSLKENTPALYGHVKLQDTFDRSITGGIIPPKLADGIAASPLLVYNALQEVAKIEDNLGNISNLKTPFTFSNDFLETNNKLSINWLEI